MTEFTANPQAAYLKPSERIVLVDVETTGLRPTSTVLEIGFRLTDLNLVELSRLTLLIEPPEVSAGLSVATYRNKQGPFIQNMHNENHLWSDLEQGLGTSLEVARAWVIEWCSLNALQGKDPICGSSVKADYDWLLESIFRGDPAGMNTCFHYRVMDISSLKEIVRRFWGDSHVWVDPNKAHRVQADIDATIKELRHYLKLLGPTSLKEL